MLTVDVTTLKCFPIYKKIVLAHVSSGTAGRKGVKFFSYHCIYCITITYMN